MVVVRRDDDNAVRVLGAHGARDGRVRAERLGRPDLRAVRDGFGVRGGLLPAIAIAAPRDRFPARSLPRRAVRDAGPRASFVAGP